MANDSYVYEPLSDLIAPEDVPPGLAKTAETAVFERIFLINQSLVQTQFGSLLSGGIALDAEAVFDVPGLPLSFVVGAADPDSAVTIQALLEDEWFVDVDGLALSLRTDPAFLRPVDPGRQFAEVKIESGIRITHDNVALTDPEVSLSLPPSEIPGTGIVVSLENLKFDFSSEASPDELLAMGYDETFRGLYAESAAVTFFPTLSFGGERGLTLSVNDLALSTSGVSFTAGVYFHVDVGGAEIAETSEARSDLFGDAWPLALISVWAEVYDNEPVEFGASGVLCVPVFNLLFDLSLTLRATDGVGYEYAALIDAVGPGVINTDFGTIAYEDVAFEAVLGDDAALISGVLTGLNVDIEPFNFSVQTASASFAHTEARDEISIGVGGIELGPLGTLDAATLVLGETRGEQGTSRDVSVEAQLTWAGLRERIALPDNFPSPPDGGAVTASVYWKSDSATGRNRLFLKLAAKLEHVDELWPFIPEEFRPEVPSATLNLEIVYEDPQAFSDSSTTDALNGTLTADLYVRVPDFTSAHGAELVELHYGDESNLICASLYAAAGADGADSLRLSVINPVSLDVQLPGLPQPEAPIHIALTEVSISYAGGAADRGSIKLAGDFALRPVLPPSNVPIAAYLQSLLAASQTSGVNGTADISLDFEDDRMALTLKCAFDGASVDIDLFKTVSELTQGRTAPAGVTEPASELPLDFNAGFTLHGVSFKLGSIEPDAGGAQTEIRLDMAIRLGGLSAEGYFSLSEKELAVGVARLEVPLRIPRFPLHADELRPLDTDGKWDSHLKSLRRSISNMEAAPAADETERELADLRGRLYLLEQVYGLRMKMSTTDKKRRLQLFLLPLVEGLDFVTGVMASESNVKLVLDKVQFALPFQDPRGIRLEGTAGLVGFADDDPFKSLEGVALTLGLSSDRIYFGLSGDPSRRIPLPDLGHYPGGYVEFGNLTIGYGFTNNSFSMAFAGAVILPPQLIEDADASDTTGIGIRLPTRTSLAFRLDLIPIPAPIPVVPAFSFAIDMRSEGAPALTSTRPCVPYWDGLQLIVPDVLRWDIKQLGFSPMYGPFPVPNLLLDGDLMLGDEKNGLTIVADNLRYMVSGPGAFYVPLFTDPLYPFFDNFCVHLRLLGFEINFDVQRPLPSFSPLALLELLAVLAEPAMKVDPDGALANVLFIALKDAYVAVPAELVALFPDLANVSKKTVNVKLSLATVIGAVQLVSEVVGSVFEAIAESQDVLSAIEYLAKHPPEIGLAQLVAAVPPELRKLRCGASFAGFEASVALLLIDAESAVGEMKRRRQPPATLQPFAPAPGQPVAESDLVNFRPEVADDDSRTYYPDDPANNLFAGTEFSSFDEDDLLSVLDIMDELAKAHASVPTSDKLGAGVVLGAHVKVFGGQRFRFLGYVYEDGSFGLVTALDIAPLKLSVTGMDVVLPLKVSARLALAGRVKRDGGYATVYAQGRVESWAGVPNVLRLSVGVKEPAVFYLTSDGRFALRGDVVVDFFNGAAVLEGAVDISETHCFVDGTFKYEVGEVKFYVHGGGRIGPGKQFEVSGDGELEIHGNKLVSVRGLIRNNFASVEAQLSTGEWDTGATRFPCSLSMKMKGTIDVRKSDKPSYTLEGEGSLAILNATVKGRGGIGRTSRGKTYAFVEGRLLWQGREWLNGKVELSNEGIKLSGRASLAFELTPSNFASIEVANLYFKLDVEGDFTLDASGGLTAYANLKADWQLSVQLPGNNKLQRNSYPIASQQFSLSVGTRLDFKLLEIRTTHLLPAEIKLPTFRIKADDHFELRVDKHRVEIPGLDPLDILIPETFFHDPSGDPLPFRVQSDISKGWSTVASLPTKLSIKTEDLIVNLPRTFDFNVYLRWDTAAKKFKLYFEKVN